eukprot:GGOE01020096.1.p1 GENE.GGOE01020096.1~~GGOE01020096.1.p1  ORF type:complete len:1145 (+),score=390.54 GGOE01020096.1:167-3436(+)
MDDIRAETLAVLANSLHPVVAHQQMVQQQEAELKSAKAERKAKVKQEQRAAAQTREAEQRAKSREVILFQQLLQQRNSEEEGRRIAALKEERSDQEKHEAQEAAAYEAAVARGEAPGLQCTKLVVSINRPREIALSREKLPILRMEGAIMDQVESDPNGVVLVCGATGSGKTTQVPQFLFEAGFSDPRSEKFPGRIAVTQPRRVAALTTAQRVAEEMSVAFGQEVGYQVRYTHRATKRTRIKFMTEGILLREMQADILLRQYSAIIIDEAHERSINTDLLIGLLSRIVPLRQQLYDEAQHRRDVRREDHRMRESLLMEAKPGTVAGGGHIPVTPLKLIIMSATLRVKDFTDNDRLFRSKPPVVDVESRQFPVTSHFSKKTPVREYLKAACRRVCQIHERLPPGGLLVFCSTQHEIELLSRMLVAIYRRKRLDYPGDVVQRRKDFARRKRAKGGKAVPTTSPQPESTAVEENTDEFGLTPEDYELSDEEEDGQAEEEDEEEEDAEEEDSGSDAGHAHGRKEVYGGKRVKRRRRALAAELALEEDEATSKGGAVDGTETAQVKGRGRKGRSALQEEVSTGHYDSLLVLPLFALLPQDLQQRVFQPPPDHQRLCVIATNVAETSITIPGIRYVLDLGRVKTKEYNAVTGVMAFRITWTSQASADQRAGRAGRTCAGHCYRLYTPAVYANLMEEFTDPEISQTPLDSLVLLMKSIGIQNISNFPFPTAINEDGLVAAMKHLRRIQALDINYRVTDLGRELTKYPLLPRYSRMLHLAQQPCAEGSVLGYMTVIVSCLSNITDIFIHVEQPEEDPPAEEAVVDNEEGKSTAEHSGEAEGAMARSRRELREQQEADRRRRKEAFDAQRKAVQQFSNPGSDLMTNLEVARHYLAAADQKKFCRDNFLIDRNMREVALLRVQLMRILSGISEYTSPEEDEMGNTPAELQGAAEASGVEVPPTRAGLDFSVGKKPTLTQEVLLRKLIAMGLVDQIARRATAAECLKCKVRYYDECLAMKSLYVDTLSGQPVWIHPFSSVARTQPCPELVCYSVLQSMRRQTKARKAPAAVKTYMKGVTIVKKQWLWEMGVQDLMGVEAR